MVNLFKSIVMNADNFRNHTPLMDTTTYDLDNPYHGPSLGNIDLWVGYGRKITDKIDWRVQLNVRNVGDGNALIPITTQPDGTHAGMRIAPAQVWSLTNTFTF